MSYYRGKNMIEKKLEINDSCSMSFITWKVAYIEPSATIEYVEHGDYWHGDTVTSADIDKEKAIEIINMLKETFNI
jgi:hypothetical protein